MGSAVDLAAATLAARQGGVFSHRQLVRLGVSPAAIGRRRRAGLWVTHHRGVYGLAGAPLTPRGREFGAMLAGGATAAVSHRAAGAHWRVRPYTPPPEITVPGPRRRSRPDLRIHTQPPFAPGDVGGRDGIRVTSPARTLIDLAGVDPPAAVERAAAEAQVLGLLTAAELQDAAERSRGRPGVAALLAALTDPAAAPTQSELELRMLRLGRPRQPRRVRARPGARRRARARRLARRPLHRPPDRRAPPSGRRRARRPAQSTPSWAKIRRMIASDDAYVESRP